MVWERNESWWAKERPQPRGQAKYIVDIVNGANNVALGLLMQGGIDLSNNFLPGSPPWSTNGYVTH